MISDELRIEMILKIFVQESQCKCAGMGDKGDNRHLAVTSDTDHVNTWWCILVLISYRLQTTTDFPIHLSYKTGHFGGLYKIP